MFITEQPIFLEKFLADPPDPSCGARALFVGTVRDHHRGKKVKRLYYDCYQSMADREIGRLIEEVKKTWAVKEVRIFHRV